MALVSLALAPEALADTYRPNKLGDPGPNRCRRDDCSLREAITKANDHAGRDTIVLQGGKTYRLSLPNSAGDEDANATGDLDVLDPLTIESSSQKLATVDAKRIDRVFEVGTSGPVSATFKRVTIRGGNASGAEHGGGIDSEYGGALRLVGSRVVANTTSAEGGGIAADGGTLRVIRSVVAHNSATNPAQNAGGIEGEPGSTQNEVIAISRSRIVDNHAGEGGGGIYAYNRLSIDRSVLSGNTAGGAGGAIYNYGTQATIAKSTIAGNRAGTGVGGGIFNVNGALTVRSSTLSGNVAQNNDGGAIENDDTATLVNDTITKNQAGGGGGGVASDSLNPTTLNAVTVARNSAGSAGGGIEGTPITVRNSLIALNSSSGLGPDCRPGPTIVSGGYNLIGDTTDCTGIFGAATHDITDTNPGIEQLASNGGPTKTIALQPHSEAIDHAGPDAPKRDQRGVKRRVKGDRVPDIGAFERR